MTFEKWWDLDADRRQFRPSSQARAAWEASANAEREAWNEKIAAACASDFEHGVKWLNAKAADDFKAAYPRLWDLVNGK